MQKNILLIGGTRFFGKLLAQRLLACGHRLTLATRGRSPDPFGDRVTRIKVDRHDAPSMRAAFAGSGGYDIIYDQMCYSPLDAAIATEVFTGKVKRYVMASTIDVYRSLLGSQQTPFCESQLDLASERIDLGYPWNTPALAAQTYAMGKRQAEAYFARESKLPLAAVRIGHVLAGPEDFTGRLAHYIDLARRHNALRYTNAAAPSSFISSREICDFLVWVGQQKFTGAVNAACDGGMSAFELFQRVGAALELPVASLPATSRAAAGELSPFDYAHPFLLDNARARSLGYSFGHSDDWVDDVIRQHDLAFA
jgi:nucleoside-diphosphate-sugar epimerase